VTAAADSERRTEPAPDPGVVLAARAVTRRFGAVAAVQDVTLDLRAGEVHALLGENGAGKSTVIRLLAGVLAPSAGEVLLHGRPLVPSPGHTVPEIGVVFQELALVPDLSVAENLLFGREPLTRLRTVSERRLRGRARDLLSELGIDGIDVDRQVGELSLAQRQRVEIARVLSVPREVVVLDEATSALSPQEVDWLLGHARRLAAAGTAVLFISHRMVEIEQVADRISVLRNGKLVGERTRGGYDADELVELMLNRRVERMFPARTTDAGIGDPVLHVRDLRWGQPTGSVDLDLHAGEILGLGGLAGQGQTGLLEALAGVRRSKGTVTVAGRPARLTSPRAALRQRPGIAFIPEDRRGQGLMVGRSVKENLVLPVLDRVSRRGIVDRAREHRLAAEAADRLQVGRRDLDQPVGQLSGGNQQKVVMAKVLGTDSRVLLLHDPTRGVDVGTKSEIFALMRRLADDGYALIFYSTDTTELLNVADRVAVVADGTISTVLAGDQLTETDLIAASLAGRSA
jgi:ribose transport system ATP-binding protein